MFILFLMSKISCIVKKFGVKARWKSIIVLFSIYFLSKISVSLRLLTLTTSKLFFLKKMIYSRSCTLMNMIINNYNYLFFIKLRFDNFIKKIIICN